METLPGVAPPEQQNTYFYIGQHETKRTVPVTTELAEQAQDAGVSSFAFLLILIVMNIACCSIRLQRNF